MQEGNAKVYRRDAERFKVETAATIISSKKEKKGLMIKDMSCKGLCGLTPYAFQLNEKVQVILQAPFFDNPVNKIAKVIWRRKTRENLWLIGLDFGLDNKLNLSHFKKSQNKDT